MPVYEFKGESSGRVVEEVFFSWRDAPKEFERDGERFVRIPSRLARTDVIDEGRAKLRQLAKQGIVPLERGMTRDFNEARIAREKAHERQRHDVIREALATAGRTA